MAALKVVNLPLMLLIVFLFNHYIELSLHVRPGPQWPPKHSKAKKTCFSLVHCVVPQHATNRDVY